MTRIMAATNAAGLTLMYAALAGAQSPAAGGGVGASSLSVLAGVAQNERRDLTASPLAFAGRGIDLTVNYARAIGSFTLDAAVQGGARRLASSDADPSSSERLTEGQLHVALLRRIDGAAASAPGFSVGLALDGSGAFTAHDYGHAGRPISNFVLGSAAIGPAASWKQRIAGGAATIALAAPAVAVVAHSYSVINRPTMGAELRFVTPGLWRGAGGTVTYAPADDRATGLVYRYRFSLLRYDDVQPVRAVTQSVSVGFTMRFGARRS